MKKLVVINGVPGVGKTTVCRELYKSIIDSVWLDGDWCWMMICNSGGVEEIKRSTEDKSM